VQKLPEKMMHKMKDIRCLNRACRRIVMTSDGRRLVTHLGKEMPFLPQKVSFDCPFCGSMIHWKREGAGK
jgi:predicted RNA-binding Zn-ribbon protein involved in translation (DUF1610 family)